MKIRSKTQTLLVRPEEFSRRKMEFEKLQKIPPIKIGELFEKAKMTHLPAHKIRDAILQMLDITEVQVNGGFGSPFDSIRNIGQIIRKTKTQITLHETHRMIFDVLRFLGRECYFAYEQTADETTVRIVPTVITIEREPQIIKLNYEEIDPRRTYVEVLDDYSLKAVELMLEAKATVDEALQYRAENSQKQEEAKMRRAKDDLFRLQMRQAGRMIAASEKLWPHTQRRLDFDRYGVKQGEIMGISRIIEHMEAAHLIDIDVFEGVITDSEAFDQQEIRKIVRMSRELFTRASKEPVDIKLEIN